MSETRHSLCLPILRKCLLIGKNLGTSRPLDPGRDYDILNKDIVFPMRYFIICSLGELRITLEEKLWGLQWVWGNCEMNRCQLVCAKINSHTKHPTEILEPADICTLFLLSVASPFKWLLHFLLSICFWWFYWRWISLRAHLKKEGNLPFWAGLLDGGTEQHRLTWSKLSGSPATTGSAGVYSLTPSRLISGAFSNSFFNTMRWLHFTLP